MSEAGTGGKAPENPKNSATAGEEAANKSSVDEKALLDSAGLESKDLPPKIVKFEQAEEKSTASGSGSANAANKTTVKYGDQFDKIGNKKVLKADVEYVDSNGYKYTTDSQGRISQVEGNLVLQKGTRNEYAQRTVGGTDRLSGDDGGHMIGTRFNGSGEIDNLVPQSSNINRSGGEWYKMEKDWAEALDAGSTVKVDIMPIYAGNSVRPVSFDVSYTIDGETFFKNIANQ